MTPINYCYEKIAAGGSPFYYCVKKISTLERDAVVAIAAFYEELTDIILKGSDLQVSINQINWWRSEIVKIATGSPDHPVARALQEKQINPQSLLNILNGLEETLNVTRFDTFETAVIHIMRTAGAREVLIADVLNVDISKEILYQFAIVLDLANYIQYLRQYVRRDFILFPQDEMNQFQVTAESLREYKTTPAIVNLLNYQLEKVERAYQKARNELPPSMSNRLSYLLARCDIAEKTLHELQRSGFTVLENFIQLTPLRMWWIAYRSG